MRVFVWTRRVKGWERSVDGSPTEGERDDAVASFVVYAMIRRRSGVSAQRLQKHFELAYSRASLLPGRALRRSPEASRRLARRRVDARP